MLGAPVDVVVAQLARAARPRSSAHGVEERGATILATEVAPCVRLAGADEAAGCGHEQQATRLFSLRVDVVQVAIDSDERRNLLLRP